MKSQRPARENFEMIRNAVNIVTAASLICLASSTLHAQDDTASSSSAEDVARQLANPNTTLATLGFPLDYIAYDGTLPGAADQSAWKLSFQPSLPYPLSKSTNLFVRPMIPLFLDQPVPVVGGASILPPGSDAGALDFSSTGLQLGDIGFDAAIGRSFSNGVILIGGVVGSLPTATDDRIGLDQYLLGPELMLGKVGGWGAVGLLVTHQWDVAGEDSFDTSITGGQYFYTFNLKNAWQISAQPTFSYNHEADSGNRLTLPIGIGISKTKVIGKTPWKFALQYWHYVEQPDNFGPDFQIRLQVSPVIPLPW